MGILSRHRYFMATAVLIAAMLAAPVKASHAQSAGHFELSEEKIKAGLIYNFLKYTTWPASAGLHESQNIRVCLLGGDAFGGYLSPLHGRTAQQYKIRIEHIRNADDGKKCTVVFINSSLSENLPAILETLDTSGILTVSDIPGFAKKGGMIELSMQKDRRIHLSINAGAARDSGIVIQDRLMKLAESVW